MKPRTALIIALLMAAAGGAVALIQGARLGQASRSDLIETAAVGGALIAGLIVMVARHNPPLTLRKASGARLLLAGALGLGIVIAYAALAFGVSTR